MAVPPGVVSQIPPNGQPLVGRDGQLDPQWRRFFETIWRRTGGFTDLVSGAQPFDDTLTALAALVFVADKLIFSTGPDAFATSDITTLARSLLADTTAAAMRTTLGAGSSTEVATAQAAAVAAQADIDATQAALGALAFLNTINDGNWSGTDLAIVNGGTGASTAANARTNLGLAALAVLNTVGTAQIDALAVTNAKLAAGAAVANIGFTPADSAGFAASVGASGYQKFPSGLIIQWGSTSVVGGTGNVSLPFTFPTACRAVTATLSGGAGTYGFVDVTAKSTTQFGAETRGSGGVLTAIQFDWFAVGN